MYTSNLIVDLPALGEAECFDVILERPGIKIERIVSHGHSSPKDFWYDQETNEWVTILKGNALLLFEGDSTRVALQPGSHLNIPAHRRHRVEWTDPNEDTVWLTVHY